MKARRSEMPAAEAGPTSPSAGTLRPPDVDASTSKGCTFLDINTFYSPRAGGIRIYYQAKLSYFASQTTHRYVLVHPGRAFAIHHDHPSVTRVEAWGPIVSADPRGYRLMLDYVRVFAVIRRLKPSVIEAGDPWLTGIFLIAMKALGVYRGTLISIFHSDPTATHVTPWAERGRFRPLRRTIARVVAAGFYLLQRGYDLTIVSSELMERRLEARGIKTVRSPFGVPDGFLDTPSSGRVDVGGNEGPVRMVYAGRLNPEKGLGLLLECLPQLLADERVHLTVIGRGPLLPRFAAFQHPRFRFLGFVEDRDEVRRLYDEHDILLAPGPHESFGLAALEGMARGLVVIGPDSGATAELLRQSDSPFIFAAGDAEDFRRKIQAAVDADRRPYRRRAREIAESYGTFQAAIGRLAAVYVTLAGQHAAARVDGDRQ